MPTQKDVFALLKEDHRRVEDLFEKLSKTTSRGVKQREKLFPKLREELTIHAEAEERFLYPEFENNKKVRDIVLESFVEHNLVKDLLRQIEKEDIASDQWKARLTVLQEMVEHHVQEEEKELFKTLRTIVSRQDAREIARKIEEFRLGAMEEESEDFNVEDTTETASGEEPKAG